MRNKYMLIGVGIVVGVLLSSVVFVLAGNPDSPAVPGATNSFTLEDIYNRLDTGATGAQSTFTEPGVAPGTGTMHTLNEIYDLIGDAGGAGVPKTGDAYDDGCCTGEDGELQKGVAWPNPRFTDNGNGTVTDNLTGLIWLKDGDCLGSGDWSTAFTYVSNLNSGTNYGCDSYTAGTYSDWRLPNVRELQSLVHYGVYDPAVPNTAGTGQWTSGDPFTGVQSSIYWSSTTYADGTTYAWYVSLSVGYVGYDDKAITYYVWPVRGGQ